MVPFFSFLEPGKGYWISCHHNASGMFGRMRCDFLTCVFVWMGIMVMDNTDMVFQNGENRFV